MSDKLTDRLMGDYEVGVNGEFGRRSFADFIPPIAIEAAQRIKELERNHERLRGQLQNCVNHLDRANRKSYGLKLDECIESANKTLYETLDV